MNRIFLLIVMMVFGFMIQAQTIEFFMPEETEEHEGTWLQWPHNHLTS